MRDHLPDLDLVPGRPPLLVFPAVGLHLIILSGAFAADCENDPPRSGRRALL
jgi:hypothetical protein